MATSVFKSLGVRFALVSVIAWTAESTTAHCSTPRPSSRQKPCLSWERPRAMLVATSAPTAVHRFSQALETRSKFTWAHWMRQTSSNPPMNSGLCAVSPGCHPSLTQSSTNEMAMEQSELSRRHAVVHSSVYRVVARPASRLGSSSVERARRHAGLHGSAQTSGARHAPLSLTIG